MPTKAAKAVADSIVDIRRPGQELHLIKEIRDGLDVPPGVEKRLPTLLLYDEAGLKLFEEITYLDPYYLTNAEIELLHKHAADMATHIPDKSVLVELGSGNLRKVDILLRALDDAGKSIDYYALDMDQPELERTLTAVQQKASYEHVRCFGLWGTYDDGLEWLQTAAVKDRPRTVLWLGSSIGNIPREPAAAFVKSFVDVLGPKDKFMIAIDATDDAARVHSAYNDSFGVTHRFVLNGLEHANTLLGRQAFELSKWKVIGKYNAQSHRHEAFVTPSEDVQVEGVTIRAGEEVRIEESHKYDALEALQLCSRAGVNRVKTWTNHVHGNYGMHLLSKNVYALPSGPEEYAASPAPQWHEWTALWQLWDTVTLQMIPQSELAEKPIKLRNACIFYLGHIPAFFDIKLTQTWPEQGPTEPAYYHKIFERGIDPDVDNPEKCHDHSEIPDTWPPLDEMLAYQARVRQRVKSIYDSGAWTLSKAARVLWLGYEHEAMHLETLLYMLIQSDKTLPPNQGECPDFAAQAKADEATAVPNEWFTIPAQDITLGLSDPETDQGPVRHFGWDIEKPPRGVHVPSFQAKARPITVGEYAEYLQETGKTTIPASWQTIDSTPIAPNDEAMLNGAATNGSVTNKLSESFLLGKAVRTVHGPVALAHALTWPVSASLDELTGCAAYMGGRIPTLEEARSLYEHADAQQALATAADGRTIPAVNGHLVNEGVQETPPQGAGVVNGSSNGTDTVPTAAAVTAAPDHAQQLDPHALFADLHAANVGFKAWHPVSVAAYGQTLVGQAAAMGGVWEWTASPLVRPPGFAPMPLYPAYSADFFDDKHYVVLGGSWATVPRIAGRRSFVNWYQRNYPYVWAGARLVRDL